VQVGTNDPLLIPPCRRYDLFLRSTAQNFHAAAKHVEFGLWGARAGSR
jgi:hypothetical protein